ncbi:MAG: hypothetical protein OIF50_11230 [Flavobacteriaceae bacterium]|nr:hypothetical protein [Flavobacteriaceae bacterium]
MSRIVVLLVLVVFQFSCNSNIDMASESTNILVYLYNKNNIEVPPPPSDTTGFRPQKKDVERNFIKDTTAFVVVFQNDLKSEELLKIEFMEAMSLGKQLSTWRNYNFTVFKMPSMQTKLERIKKTNQIKSIKTAKEKYDVDGVLYISNIWYNSKQNKAVVKLGVYTHGLSGYTAYIGLEKKQQWSQKYFYLMEES